MTAPSFRGRRVAETPEDAAPRTEAGYRVRDFSPEARRAALQNWSQPATTDGALTYQTQQRPPAPVEPTPATDWSAPAQPAAAPAPQPAGRSRLHRRPRRRRAARAHAHPSRAARHPRGPGPSARDRPRLRRLRHPRPPPLRRSSSRRRGPPEQYVGPVQYATGPEQYATPATITSPSHYADPVAPSETTSTNDQFSAFEALFGSEQQPATAAPEQEFPTQYAHPLPTIPPASCARAGPLEAPVVRGAASTTQPPTRRRRRRRAAGLRGARLRALAAPRSRRRGAAELPVYEAPVEPTARLRGARRRGPRDHRRAPGRALVASGRARRRDPVRDPARSRARSASA